MGQGRLGVRPEKTYSAKRRPYSWLETPTKRVLWTDNYVRLLGRCRHLRAQVAYGHSSLAWPFFDRIDTASNKFLELYQTLFQCRWSGSWHKWQDPKTGTANSPLNVFSHHIRNASVCYRSPKGALSILYKSLIIRSDCWFQFLETLASNPRQLLTGHNNPIPLWM